jgi:stearoyl-CoA desaturase (delta-9 desaturase)
MFATQLLAVGGVIYYWNPYWLLLSVLGVFLFVSIGFECYLHRYLTHRTFQVAKPVEVLMHLCGVFALQGPPLLWAANHVSHHAHADRPGDPHPAVHGWRSWFWVGTNTNATMSPSAVKRLLRDPLCVWSHKHYFKIYLGGALLATLIDPRITVYFLFIPAMYSFHTAGFITVVLHRFGYRNFETADTSRNLLISVLFLSSPFHNNHHARPGDYNTAVKWYEVDFHAWLIRLLAKSHATVQKTKPANTV